MHDILQLCTHDTHLGDHSHCLVSESDSFSIGSTHLDEHEVVDSALAVVGDVLTNVRVLETKEPQGNGALRVVKLYTFREGYLDTSVHAYYVKQV